MIIPCVTNFKFRARPWKLGDIGTLLNDKEGREGFLPQRMAELATEPGGVVDPGPYPFAVGGDVDWNLVTQADLVTANVAIRIATDPLITLQPNCRRCGKLQEALEFDLSGLEAYEASDDGIQHITTGIPVPITLIDNTGRQITVHLRALRGSHLPALSTLQSQEQTSMIEIQTCMHIHKITWNGQEGAMDHLPAIRAFWKNQSWAFRDAVTDKIDELFGGMDLSYRYTCDDIINCRSEQEGVIPLDMTFYGLTPRRTRQKRAKFSLAGRLSAMSTQISSSPSVQDTPKSST